LNIIPPQKVIDVEKIIREAADAVGKKMASRN
jgi:hypothetical protein